MEPSRKEVKTPGGGKHMVGEVAAPLPLPVTTDWIIVNVHPAGDHHIWGSFYKDLRKWYPLVAVAMSEESSDDVWCKWSVRMVIVLASWNELRLLWTLVKCTVDFSIKNRLLEDHFPRCYRYKVNRSYSRVWVTSPHQSSCCFNGLPAGQDLRLWRGG